MSREIHELVAATLGDVIDPINNARTDLLRTLIAYLEHGAGISVTATAMQTHRHTISYRLGRIAQLTGHDPQTAYGQAQLSLGLQALAIRRAMTEPVA